MSAATIQTDRLLLRRWRESDLAPYAAICGDAEVMRYVGSGSIRTTEQTKVSILAFEQAWRKSGYGLFAVERIGDGQLIGYTGLSTPDFLPEILPAVEIGWRYSRAHWGMGYATEAAQAALDFGLTYLGLPEIVSIHQVGNEASRRIMEKLGMIFERETTDPASGRTVHIYRTRAPE